MKKQRIDLLFFIHAFPLDVTGKKQGRNEFVMRLQPNEAMYMKLTVCICSISVVLKCSEAVLNFGFRDILRTDKN